MTWLALLALAVVVVALFTLVSARPRGGRPVEGTQLMTAGRVVVAVMVLGLLYVAISR